MKPSEFVLSPIPEPEPKTVTYRVRFYGEPGMLFGVTLGQCFNGAHASWVKNIGKDDSSEEWNIEVSEDQAERLTAMLERWQSVRVSAWSRLDQIPEDWK